MAPTIARRGQKEVQETNPGRMPDHVQDLCARVVAALIELRGAAGSLVRVRGWGADEIGWPEVKQDLRALSWFAGQVQGLLLGYCPFSVAELLEGEPGEE